MITERALARQAEPTIELLLFEFTKVVESALSMASAEVSRVADMSSVSKRVGLGDLSHIELLTRRLNAEFSPPLRPEAVGHCLVESIRSFESATVRNFLPVLIERTARGRLAELAVSRAP